ncbi:MAG: TonB-dependent receptor [Bryobacterales bacterium]|nr:TonB-dependent receptor [Bryobacterales bacterium]
MSKSTLRAIAILISAAILAPAQEVRSAIFGRVLDPSQAAVSGASVVVTNTGTNVSVTLTSNDTGYYEANFLVAGLYKIRVEANGFKQALFDSIDLPVGSRLEVGFRLELGSVTESVKVTADTPLLETASVSSGRVMDNRNVTDLPTFNNSPLLLMKLVPGVQSGNSRRYNGVNALGGVNEANNGSRVGGTEYALDGAPNVGQNYSANYLPYSTTIQEFKVDTSNFDASVGHGSGLSVSIMTKAGGNETHGNLTWQHWQERWNGARFFVKQAYYRQISAAETAGNTALASDLRNRPMIASGRSNNYGVTVGGPIRIPKIIDGRNKLFYFASMDGFEDRKNAETGFIRTLPTLANRNGDFSDLQRIDPVRYTIYDPLSVRPDPSRPRNFIRDPLPSNILPQNRIVNPAYRAYAGFLPTPNTPPLNPRDEPLNNYTGSAEPFNWSYKSVSNRIDYNLSDRHRLFGRWTWMKYREDRQDWTYETVRGLHTNGVNRNLKSAMLDYVFTQSGSTVYDILASMSDFEEGSAFRVPFDFPPSKLGLPAYLDQKAAANAVLPIMTANGYQTMGQPVAAFAQNQLLSVNSTVMHIRGAHTIRAGISARRYQKYNGQPGITSGSFTFNNQFTRREDDNLTPAGNLGHSWAAFMMGLPTNLRIDTNDSHATASYSTGWFLQDQWRIDNKLTLNVGLRLEYELGLRERFNRALTYFDPSLTLPITEGAQAAYARSPVAELAASSFQVRGGSRYAGVNGAPERLNQNELVWMPRIGVAYSLNSSTVLRAGYGAYFDTINATIREPDLFGFSRTTESNPTDNFGVDWLLGNPRAGVSPMADPFPVRRDGSRFDTPVGAALGPLARAGNGWTFMPFDTRRARQHRWRVDLQKQIGQNVFSIGYAGSYSDRVRVTQRLDALPEQFWASGNTRNDSAANNLNQNIANPFRLANFPSLQQSDPAAFQQLSTQSYFTAALIRKNSLLRPFPQMNGLNQTFAPLGRVRTDSIEAVYQRRFARGLSLNFSYVAMRGREANEFFNEFDPKPMYLISNDSFPHRFSGTGVWELPFGKGRQHLQSGVLSHIAGGWQLAATYEWQQGEPLNWPSLFYNGDPANISSTGRTLDRWFNTDGFERLAARGPAAFQKRVFPIRLGNVRADGLDRMDTNVQRDFRFNERAALQLRLDVLNVFNRSQFAAPVVDPFSTNFGRVTNHTATTMRFLLVQARIKF